MARDYAREYREYGGTEIQKKNRAKRNKALRQEMRLGNVHKGDGMDVDHKKPLIKGGGVSLSNLRVVSQHANRSFKRTRTAGMK